MTDEILSDEDLALWHAQALEDAKMGGAEEFYSHRILALIARLERAEQHQKQTQHWLDHFIGTASEQSVEAWKMKLERDEALKCLAAAPEPNLSDDNNGGQSVSYWVDEEAYADWYHSPTRQNLIKGQK